MIYLKHLHPTFFVIDNVWLYTVSIERIESENCEWTHTNLYTIPVLLSVEQTSVTRPLSDRTWIATNTKSCTSTTIPVSHINVLTPRREITKARIWNISSVFRSYCTEKRNSQKFRWCSSFVNSIMWSSAWRSNVFFLKTVFVTDFHNENSVKRNC